MSQQAMDLPASAVQILSSLYGIPAVQPSGRYLQCQRTEFCKNLGQPTGRYWRVQCLHLLTALYQHNGCKVTTMDDTLESGPLITSPLPLIHTWPSNVLVGSGIGINLACVFMHIREPAVLDDYRSLCNAGGKVTQRFKRILLEPLVIMHPPVIAAILSALERK